MLSKPIKVRFNEEIQSEKHYGFSGSRDYACGLIFWSQHDGWSVNTNKLNNRPKCVNYITYLENCVTN